MKKHLFQPVDPKVNFPEMEKRQLSWWYESGVVDKYLHKNDKSRKEFSFLDGPITANNPMGVHHARGRTYKDLWQRYYTMRGYKQRYQNGFDCQGLWVEVEVEKTLGFNSKKDIEVFGIEKFTEECIARVNKFSRQQTEQSKRLGYFMNWDNSYYTMSETNNLYIWKFLQLCHQRHLIYKNKSATTWCPRCETGLSKHEQADSYKDVNDTSAYVKFKIKNRDNEFLLVWTTTPWTLPANVLAAINTKHKYVKAKSGNEIYYLAEGAAHRLGLNDTTTTNERDLLGIEYESLYDFPAQKGIKHYVVEWELVDPKEGTGIVHIAPGCGEEDFELGKKLQAPAISPLGSSGKFSDGYGDLSGKYAHDVGQEIVGQLKSKNLLYKTELVTHSYPHCWRCGTKCLFRLEDNWFINCSAIRGDLKALANKANWVPAFVGKRMQNWLDMMGDWMISRKRYYGLALPFYECKKCSLLTVVGSKSELKSLAEKSEMVDSLPSLHRPWIDAIKIKCPKCGEIVERIIDVGDCWLDAGVVPFSTLKYFEDKKYWQEWFPADLVLEMVEQVRLWYYSMLVYGYIFENKIPYKNVLNHGEVRDEKGERMSKTKGNGIPYDEAVEKMGADVMRWIYLTQNPDENVNFGYKIADESRRRFHLTLWNVYNFFVTYANVEKWQPAKPREIRVLDKWVLTRLNETITEVTDSLNQYDAKTASKSLENFISDLSLWYIRRSRDRVGPAFYATCYEVLTTLCKLLAPFTPFIAEEIYQNLTGKESVHLASWPEIKNQKSKIKDQKLLKDMGLVRKICELGHAARKTAGIRVRQPLAKLKVKSQKLKVTNNDLLELIKDELNVKSVEFVSGEEGIEFDIRLTSELLAEGQARELVRQIQEARKGAGTALDQKIEVMLPDWPKEFEEYIKKQTLATKLTHGDSFKII